MSDKSISDEAVKAAAEVGYNASHEHGDRLRGFTIGPRYADLHDDVRAAVNEQMRAALAAAVPIIRADIAQAILAERDRWLPASPNEGRRQGLLLAARIARGQA